MRVGRKWRCTGRPTPRCGSGCKNGLLNAAYFSSKPEIIDDPENSKYAAVGGDPLRHIDVPRDPKVIVRHGRRFKCGRGASRALTGAHC